MICKFNIPDERRLKNVESLDEKVWYAKRRKITKSELGEKMSAPRRRNTNCSDESEAPMPAVTNPFAAPRPKLGDFVDRRMSTRNHGLF